MKTILPRIALRNLARQKKRTMLLGAAIAFGIMIVTIINGFAGAFVANVSENFAYLMAGHVFVRGSEKTESGRTLSVVRDDEAIRRAIEASGISPVRVTRSSEVQATLVFEGKSTRQSLTGLDIAGSPFLGERLAILEGSWQATSAQDALILSARTAKKLNVHPGDRLLAQFRTATGQNNVVDFTVAAVSADSSIVGSVLAYVNITYLNKALGLGDHEYMALGIMLRDLKSAPKAADALFSSLKGSGLQLFERAAKNEDGGSTPFMAMLRGRSGETWDGVKYSVITIDDIMSQARQIVVALDTASVVILFVLFAIVMIGISNTFRMVMYERIKEIGTMRAIGVQRREVRRLFLLEALFLALAGTAAGILAAQLVMALVSLYDFGMNSPAFLIMRNGHLSFRVPFFRALANLGLIVVLTVAAAFFPARAAAKLQPAEALRSLK